MAWIRVLTLASMLAVVLAKTSYVINTKSLPSHADGSTNHHLLPQVGNGHLAHVPFTDHLHMNGLFNGLQELSHRAKIPAFVAFNFTIMAWGLDPRTYNDSYSLNLDDGCFTRRVTFSEFFIDVELKIFANAHPQFGTLLVYDLNLAKLPGAPRDLEFDVHLKPISKGRSRDLKLTEKSSYSNVVHLEASTTVPESAGVRSQKFHIFYQRPRALLSFTERDSGPLRFTFVQSVHYDEDKAKQAFQSAVESPPKSIFQLHQSQWQEVWWRHRVQIPKNPELDLLAQTSLYTMYSSIPTFIERKHTGVGSDGLARAQMKGLTTWIQEAWVLPVMNLLDTERSRSLLEVRKRQWSRLTKGGKVTFPKLVGTGAQDLSYDCEKCTEDNECQICKSSNDHVTAGVALAIKQYISATSDLDLLRSGGYDVMADISRGFEERKSDQSEFVQLSGPNIMMFTYYSACLIGRHRILVIPERWRSHPDLHKRYGCATTRSFGKDRRDITDPRLDVPASVLLFNWLPYSVKASQKRLILTEYEHSLRKQQAPSPGYSALVSGWLDLGEETKANELMQETLSYVRGPFKNWMDTSDLTQAGVTDYLPAASAYMQTLLYGYLGARIYPNKITFKPRVNGLGGALVVTGLKYQGSTYDVKVDKGIVNLTMLQQGLVETQYKLSSYDQWIPMKLDASVIFPLQTFTIRSVPYSQAAECQTPDPMNLPACMEESEITGYTSTVNSANLMVNTKISIALISLTVWIMYRSWV